MYPTKDILLADIRHDVKAARLRALRWDICKTLAWWVIVPTLFYFATRENKYLGPQVNLPMFISVLLILLLIPLLWFKMWQYPGSLRGVHGKVVQKRARLERVTRTDRNVGYTNRGGDMVSVNVMDVVLQRADGKRTTVKMLGNHLFNVGQSYYAEGDDVERFAGAAYLYNHTAGRKTQRAFCLYCGYLGAPDEKKCSRCSCTLLTPDTCLDEEK